MEGAESRTKLPVLWLGSEEQSVHVSYKIQPLDGYEPLHMSCWGTLQVQAKGSIYTTNIRHQPCSFSFSWEWLLGTYSTSALGSLPGLAEHTVWKAEFTEEKLPEPWYIWEAVLWHESSCVRIGQASPAFLSFGLTVAGLWPGAPLTRTPSCSLLLPGQEAPPCASSVLCFWSPNLQGQLRMGWWWCPIHRYRVHTSQSLLKERVFTTCCGSTLNVLQTPQVKKTSKQTTCKAIPSSEELPWEKECPRTPIEINYTVFPWHFFSDGFK